MWSVIDFVVGSIDSQCTIFKLLKFYQDSSYPQSMTICFKLNSDWKCWGFESWVWKLYFCKVQVISGIEILRLIMCVFVVLHQKVTLEKDWIV